MKRYICDICAYEYTAQNGDEQNNIPPNTTWDALPENWTCPICGAEKSDFLITGKDD